VRLLAALACATAVAAGAPGAAHADSSAVIHADAVKWEPSATLFWTINQAAVMSLFENGECTAWAAFKRPDVLQQIIVHMVGVELAAKQDELLTGLDARYWVLQAAASGIRTGRKPAAHGLMVFQPDVLNAGPNGHIAYVERVERNGKLRVSEMHAPSLYQVSYRTLPASAGRLAGVRFIY
jgi:surface antigen